MAIPLKVSLYVVVVSALLTMAIKLNYKDLTAYFAPRHDYVSVFSNIYETKQWGEGSGLGSNPSNAAPYIGLLQTYFDDPQINTIVDLGCGDWRIMSHISIPSGKSYQGFDVVPNIIAVNKQKYAKRNVQFYAIKDLREFKSKKISGDLLVIKDVMQHWPNEEITYLIDNILPNFKQALITDCYGARTADISVPVVNVDVKLGLYRPLDLTKSPFNLQHVTTILEYNGPEPKRVSLYVNPSHAGRE